jgi:hypothetical protein
MHPVKVVLFFVSLLLSWNMAAAQSDDNRFQLGPSVTGLGSTEFDSTDFGVGGRFSLAVTPLLGLEAEVTYFPEDLGERVTFSPGRLEGLFGVTVGPTLDRVRPFLKLRPGFVIWQELSQPFACVLIFPPPLSCELAAGKTTFAVDAGGGIEFYPTGGTFIRVDAADRVVWYPTPAIDTEGVVRQDAFYGHDFRFSLGAGVRF